MIYLPVKRIFTLVTGLILLISLQAQWREMQFDDSDMALDLTEALTFQKYPTYEQYTEMMRNFAKDYPEICLLDTFGYSVEGRLLLALKISDQVEQEEAEADFFYTSTMHGDELVGFVLLLRLADYLLRGYGTDSEVTDLVDHLTVWINPLANPDGSYSADSGMSLKQSTRKTQQAIDLNRNFPDPGQDEPDDTTGRALENRYMMEFLRKQKFTLSANIHSGAEVVNYPWDHTAALHADDEWYRFISREYADEAMAVDPDYMFGWPDVGITNGAEWYIITGGRQDYVNYYLEGREVTLELASEMKLPSHLLDRYWNINRRSLLNYMAHCMYGIRGMVTDSQTGDPVRVRISIPDHDSIYSVVHSSARHGDFYRLIKEGVYDLVISAPGYLTDTLKGVSVTDYQATWVDIQMEKDPKAALQQDPDSRFRVYPNPFHQELLIESIPQMKGPGEIRIYGADGVLHLQKTIHLSEDPFRLSTRVLPRGLYIVRITSGSYTYSQIFIKP
jgi:hypothetical protein